MASSSYEFPDVPADNPTLSGLKEATGGPPSGSGGSGGDGNKNLYRPYVEHNPKKTFYEMIKESREMKKREISNKREMMRQQMRNSIKRYATMRERSLSDANARPMSFNSSRFAPSTLSEKEKKVNDRYRELLGYKQARANPQPQKQTVKQTPVGDGDEEDREIARKILKKSFDSIDSKQPPSKEHIRKAQLNIRPIGFELGKPPTANKPGKEISRQSMKLAAGPPEGDDEEDLTIDVDMSALTEDENAALVPIDKKLAEMKEKALLLKDAEGKDLITDKDLEILETVAKREAKGMSNLIRNAEEKARYEKIKENLGEDADLYPSYLFKQNKTLLRISQRQKEEARKRAEEAARKKAAEEEARKKAAAEASSKAEEEEEEDDLPDLEDAGETQKLADTSTINLEKLTETIDSYEKGKNLSKEQKNAILYYVNYVIDTNGTLSVPFDEAFKDNPNYKGHFYKAKNKFAKGELMNYINLLLVKHKEDEENKQASSDQSDKPDKPEDTGKFHIREKIDDIDLTEDQGSLLPNEMHEDPDYSYTGFQNGEDQFYDDYFPHPDNIQFEEAANLLNNIKANKVIESLSDERIKIYGYYGINFSQQLETKDNIKLPQKISEYLTLYAINFNQNVNYNRDDPEDVMNEKNHIRYVIKYLTSNTLGNSNPMTNEDFKRLVETIKRQEELKEQKARLETMIQSKDENYLKGKPQIPGRVQPEEEKQEEEKQEKGKQEKGKGEKKKNK